MGPGSVWRASYRVTDPPSLNLNCRDLVEELGSWVRRDFPDLPPKVCSKYIQSVSLNHGTFCDPHSNQGEAYSLTQAKAKASKPTNKQLSYFKHLTNGNVRSGAQELPLP